MGLLAQDEMLGSVKDTEWSVLIMDAVTTRVMSSICRISEILDYGVSCKSPRCHLIQPLQPRCLVLHRSLGVFPSFCQCIRPLLM